MRFASGWNELQCTLYLDSLAIHMHILESWTRIANMLCSNERRRERKEMQMEEEEDCIITTGQMTQANTAREESEKERNWSLNAEIYYNVCVAGNSEQICAARIQSAYSSRFSYVYFDELKMDRIHNSTHNLDVFSAYNTQPITE